MALDNSGKSIGFEPNADTLHDLLSTDAPLKVPIYQRPIVWDKEVCEKAFSDAMSQQDEEHDYFGAILLDIVENKNKPFNLRKITDGQQRVTWASMVARGLIEYFEEVKNECEDEKDRLVGNIIHSYNNNGGNLNDLSEKLGDIKEKIRILSNDIKNVEI